MAKNKKKKKYQSTDKKKGGLLIGVDESISSQYHDIIADIEDMQYEIYLEDKKANKKMRKKMKKGKGGFYNSASVSVREKAVKKLKKRGILDFVLDIIEDIKPIVIIIARLIGALICSILSLDIVKEHIGGKTLNKMQKIYKTCMSIS